MAKVTVTHEFDYYEERHELMELIHGRDAKGALFEVDQEIRAKVKYGEDEWLTEKVYNYLERLRDMIWESGALRDD